MALSKSWTSITRWSRRVGTVRPLPIYLPIGPVIPCPRRRREESGDRRHERRGRRVPGPTGGRDDGPGLGRAGLGGGPAQGGGGGGRRGGRGRREEEARGRARGGQASAEGRRRIVLAAVVFGRQFEERAAERPPEVYEDGARRFLMDLMNRVVREFARQEGMGVGEAAEFLGEVGTRDRVLEFSEVLDAHAESGGSLDGLLREAVELRRGGGVRAGRGGGGG